MLQLHVIVDGLLLSIKDSLFLFLLLLVRSHGCPIAAILQTSIHHPSPYQYLIITHNKKKVIAFFFAVLGMIYLGDNDPSHFGSLTIALVSLFQAPKILLSHNATTLVLD